MQIKQLVNVKKSIEKFFYKMRYNIGLESLLATTRHEGFRRKIEKALEDQMLYYAKFEKINDIIGLQKNHYESKDTQLKTNISRIWVPLFAIIEEQEVQDYFEYVANTSGQIALDHVTKGAVFELTNTPLLRSINTRVKEFAVVIDNTTKDWLTRRVEQGISAKLNSFDIAKMLRDDAPDVAFDRSMTIAEHETALLYGKMVNEVYRKNRVETVKWVTARDEGVCTICNGNELAGIIKTGNNFPSGDSAPPAHVNCRCFVLPASNKVLEVKWTGN